jgi:hypothetical protein
VSATGSNNAVMYTLSGHLRAAAERKEVEREDACKTPGDTRSSSFSHFLSWHICGRLESEGEARQDGAYINRVSPVNQPR